MPHQDDFPPSSHASFAKWTHVSVSRSRQRERTYNCDNCDQFDKYGSCMHTLFAQHRGETIEQLGTVGE